MAGGKAVIVNGYKCIGHSPCAEVCPVGAVIMVRATLSMGADMPAMSDKYESRIANMFIIGELGGLALIKNAVNQGRECVDTIQGRLPAAGVPSRTQGVDAPSSWHSAAPAHRASSGLRESNCP